MSWKILAYRGPLSTREWRQTHPLNKTLDVIERSDDCVWEGYLLGALRDYERAKAALKQAESFHPENYWLWIVRGILESWKDRPEAAVDFLMRAYEPNPHSVGLVHILADTYMSLGKDLEALSILEYGVTNLEATSCPSACTNCNWSLMI